MSPQNTLIISNKKQQPLNKQQQAFNKLVKKIEKLRLKIQQTSETLDRQLEMYSKEIYPLEQQILAKTKDLVKQYFDIHQNTKFLNKGEKKTLKEIISEELDFILSQETDPDDELKKIFRFANGQKYEDSLDDQFEEMKSDMETMFGAFGMNIDLSDIDRETGQEELAQRLKLMEEELRDKQQQSFYQENPRKKTVKQLQKEAKEKQLEEARNKNISSIYRQLAKAFHPDLEQNIEKKAEKEILMQQLTAAYEAKDLHSLLKLELEWIHKEEEHLNELTNEKLQIYNTVLKEQVHELEQEKNMILQHPRYLPLAKYINPFLEDMSNIDLQKRKPEILDRITDIEQSLIQLKGPNALKVIKEKVRIFKMAFKMNNADFDFFSELMFNDGKDPF